MQLKSGTLLERGKYRIVSLLGQGGFGITYLAEHKLTGRKVCIKEFFPKNYYNRDANTNRVYIGSQVSVDMMRRYKDKFIKEASVLAHLNHPNIVSVYDVFEENDTAYYVMEYIEGESLSAIVKRRGALDETTAVGYIRSVASALSYIHERNINHLDIKPGNIMIGGGGDAILIDFGLAKHYDTSGGQTSSTPVGISHGYAPIEQYKTGGVSSFSPTTDIYSLGATLYTLVTGDVAPEATIVGEEGVGAMPVHISPNTYQAIERSMSFWRKDRPQNIAEFLALLGSSVVANRGEATAKLDVLPQADCGSPSASETTILGDGSCGVLNGHEWVDLGLPSGTKWATCNVGAKKPEEYGDYFAWGEVATKSGYSADDYKISVSIPVQKISDLLLRKKKYEYIDISGDNRYDAATANWGKDWRMPTTKQIKELKDNCTWTWTERNGVNGYEINSKKNGNSIFLVAAGCCWNDKKCDVGLYGNYWSSISDSHDCAYILLCGSDYLGIENSERYDGCSVRPVLAE